jgi:hypothetical protein
MTNQNHHDSDRDDTPEIPRGDSLDALLRTWHDENAASARAKRDEIIGALTLRQLEERVAHVRDHGREGLPIHTKLRVRDKNVQGNLVRSDEVFDYLRDVVRPVFTESFRNTSELAQRVLVVTTASARANWGREIRDWQSIPRRVYVAYTGKPFDAAAFDAVVVGWDGAAGLAKALSAYRWDVVILDESFAALDPQTLAAALAAARRRAHTLLVIAHP